MSSHSFLRLTPFLGHAEDLQENRFMLCWKFIIITDVILKASDHSKLTCSTSTWRNQDVDTSAKIKALFNCLQTSHHTKTASAASILVTENCLGLRFISGCVHFYLPVPSFFFKACYQYCLNFNKGVSITTGNKTQVHYQKIGKN